MQIVSHRGRFCGAEVSTEVEVSLSGGGWLLAQIGDSAGLGKTGEASKNEL